MKLQTRQVLRNLTGLRVRQTSEVFKTSEVSFGAAMNCTLWRSRTPKTNEVARAVRGVAPDAARDTKVVTTVEPTAPAQHLPRPARRSRRVAGRGDAVVIHLVPIVHPLLRVARHILRAIRTRASRMVTHATSVTNTIITVVEVCPRAIGYCVAPGIQSRVVASACRLLPLGFGRQSLPAPWQYAPA